MVFYIQDEIVVTILIKIKGLHFKVLKLGQSLHVHVDWFSQPWSQYPY